MEIASNFDAKLLTSIARDSASKQAVRDVSFVRRFYFKTRGFERRQPTLYVRHTEDSFIIATLTRKHFRIIGIATREKSKGKGLASFLLDGGVKFARECGYSLIYTRSHDGKDFYLHKGFKIIGQQGGDYQMTLKI